MLIAATFAFAFGFFGSVPLAGPVALLVVARGVSGRFREAIRLALGAALAEGIYAFVAFWGFATILASHPIVVPLSRAVASVALIAVGARFTVWHNPGEEAAASVRRDRFESLAVGFGASAFNPTLLATWSAAVAALFATHWVRFRGALALPFAVCATAGIAAWFVLFVAILRHVHSRFPARLLMWIVRAMGAVLVLVGLGFAASFVRYLRG